MVEKRSWQEFREQGFLWWINMILHTFGWAITVTIDDETKEIIEVYPARVKYRGFNEDNNTLGYQRVSKFMVENAEQLEKEALE